MDLKNSHGIVEKLSCGERLPAATRLTVEHVEMLGEFALTKLSFFFLGPFRERSFKRIHEVL